MYDNQKNHWNVKQQDGAEELTDFNTIHGIQRFISIYPTNSLIYGKHYVALENLSQ